MKRHLTIMVFLIFALVGCSAEAPEPVITEPATTAAAQAPATTDAPATGEDPAATIESPGSEPAATTDAAAPDPGATTDAAPDPAATTEAPATDPGATAEPATTEGTVPVSDVPATIDISTAQATIITDTAGYFRLQTLFSEEEGTCLEGNNRSDGAALGGATFMDACRNVSGQLWKLTPAEQEGYYKLQTRFLEDQNKCLEGNQIAPDAVLGGAAFQDDCKDVTGQVWKLVSVLQSDADAAIDREIVEMRNSTGATIEDTSVYYRLQSAGDTTTCLEGNGISDGAALDGAAFMDACQDVTGQMWFVIPTERAEYYRLQPKSHERQGNCFDGNQISTDAILGGAAFMNSCSTESAQSWKFIDAGAGNYRIQTEFSATENKCLEGNRPTDGAAVGGAAFMDTCQNVQGQVWKLVPFEGSTTVPPDVTATVQ